MSWLFLRRYGPQSTWGPKEAINELTLRSRNYEHSAGCQEIMNIVESYIPDGQESSLSSRVHAIGRPGEEVVHSAVYYGVQTPVVPIVE